MYKREKLRLIIKIATTKKQTEKGMSDFLKFNVKSFHCFTFTLNVRNEILIGGTE